MMAKKVVELFSCAAMPALGVCVKSSCQTDIGHIWQQVNLGGHRTEDAFVNRAVLFISFHCELKTLI